MSRAPLPTTAMTTMTTTMTATMPTTPPTARGRARGERHETYIEHRLTMAALTSGHVAAALVAAPLHVRLTARSRSMRCVAFCCVAFDALSGEVADDD